MERDLVPADCRMMDQDVITLKIQLVKKQVSSRELIMVTAESLRISLFLEKLND